MKRMMTIVLATLFAASTGVFAAQHMKGDKDKAKAKATPSADKKGGDKKGGDKKDKGAKK